LRPVVLVLSDMMLVLSALAGRRRIPAAVVSTDWSVC
jgi:hypothetical protein